MDEPDALQTEGSSDSFQNFLNQALQFGPSSDLPDVQPPEGSGDSPHSKGVASNQETGSDTGMRRDVLPGPAAAAAAVNLAVEHTSHPSSAAGSEHTPSADAQPPRGRGRGRGRQRKRVSGQGETAQQRAHRRFYERKKQKLAALEQEAAEKLALYQRLLRDNTELQRKYNALKCTIAGRDEQMNLLQAMSSLCITTASTQPSASQDTTDQAAAAAMEGLDLPPAAAAAAAAATQQQLDPDSPQGVQSALMAPAAAAALRDVSGSASTPLQRRAGSAPLKFQPPSQQQQQQQQLQYPDQLAAAGPFGTVQLQLQAQQNPPAAAAEGGVSMYAWQQPVLKPEPQMLMPQLWPEAQQQQQQQQQQKPPPPVHPHPQDVSILNLTRSVSMPARHYPSDPGAGSSAAAATAAAGQGITFPGQSVADMMPRAYSSSPQAWHGSSTFRPGSSSSFGQQQQQQQPAPGGWTAGPSRLQQSSIASHQHQQQQLAYPQQVMQGVGRPHSWSGPGSAAEERALQRYSQSFPSASPPSHGSPPAIQLMQQQQLQEQQQHPRRGFPIVTTGGPMPAQLQQQQFQLGRSGSAPTAAALGQQPVMPHPQLLWQQQQQSLPPAGFGTPQQQQHFMMSMMPPVVQQQHSLQVPVVAAAVPGQPVLGQFASLAPAQQADDLMMIDEELMLLLDKELLQQSPTHQPQMTTGQQQEAAEAGAAGPLSSFPSFPSAGAEFADAAAAAAAAAATAGMPPPPPQQRGGLHGSPATAAAAGAGGSVPQTLLVASRLLQARHEAAGYFPAAAAGEADFCYLHQLVDWYKGKMQQLSELLPRVDRACPDVSAGVALVQVVEELIMGIRKFSARNRVGLWELKLINLDSGDFEEAPPNHWRNVLHSIAFTPAVREKLDACFTLYKGYVHKARDERQEVLRELAALAAELPGEPAAADAAQFASAEAAAAAFQQQRQQREAPPTLQFRQDGLDEWFALLEKLQVSMQREHMVCNMIMYSCAQVATHIQMGRAMLNSYPYWPNGAAILSVMHEEEQLAAAAAAGRTAWPEAPGRMRSI